MLLEIEKIKNRKFFKTRTWTEYELNVLNNMLQDFKLTSSFIGRIEFYKDNNIKCWYQRYKRFIKNGKKITKYNYLMRYGKKVCVIKWAEHVKKLKYINSKQYYIDRFGQELGEINYKKRFDNNSFKNPDVQRKNSLKSLEKRRANPELYNDIMQNQLGYWLKQGYSEDEAKKLVSERQATFSLEKCIARHGEVEGKRIFDERQIKWQNTLDSKSQEEKDEINKKKNPLVKKENESKEEFLNRTKYLTTSAIFDDYDLKTHILDKLKNNKWKYYTKQDFIDNLIFTGNSDINISEYLDSLEFEFSDENLIYQNKRGNNYLKIEEGTLRSINEIIFYDELKLRNIKFKLDRGYPNSNLRYDFYLYEYDIYVEIAGNMSDEGYANNMYYKNTMFGSFILEPGDIQDFFKRMDNNEFAKINSNI